MVYKHTQRSYLTIPFVILLAFLTFNPMSGDQTAWPHLAVVAFLAVAVLLFSTLTVKIVNGNLIWHFTLDFWKKSVPVSEIKKHEVVRNNWYYGWGIRKIRHGWLYNIYGLDPIELQLSGGRVIRIGTDEPGTLSRTIDAAIAAKA